MIKIWRVELLGELGKIRSRKGSMKDNQSLNAIYYIEDVIGE
jgi:hypothetical protein